VVEQLGLFLQREPGDQIRNALVHGPVHIQIGGRHIRFLRLDAIARQHSQNGENERLGHSGILHYRPSPANGKEAGSKTPFDLEG